MRRVRLTDPETSREAAISLSNLRLSQSVILNAVREWGPCSDEEIYDFVSGFHRISVSGARTRRKELVDMGLVRDSGQRNITKSGRRTIMWEITDEARSRVRVREVDEGNRALDQRGERQRPQMEASEGGNVHPSHHRGARQRTIRLP